jgi:formylglycine-generating enzyme required for sulfatase activity
VNGVECILPPLSPAPTGTYAMGSDKARDKQAHDDEMTQYPIMVGSFSISQHPLTVAEYACAVRAKMVREPRWEYQGTVVDWPTQLTRLEHPVVYVNWHDAVAYTHWLAKTTGQLWRLPSEAEWEKAARSMDGRIYPWGDAFDKTRCNTSEGGKGGTTPVGRYPTGASPYGAQDMAGNVWEWTSSLYKPYPYRMDDGRERADATEHRVLRGGSWYGGARHARAAFRYHLRSDLLSDVSGFRLACGVAGS